MMPKTECNNNNVFSGDGFAKMGYVENTFSDNDEDEEVPLLAIPMLMLRRASTSFGFKGMGSIRNEEKEMILEVETTEQFRIITHDMEVR